MTVPGVGMLTVLIFRHTIDDPSRSSQQQVSAYGGSGNVDQISPRTGDDLPAKPIVSLLLAFQKPDGNDFFNGPVGERRNERNGAD